MDRASTVITIGDQEFQVKLTGTFSRERVGHDADGNRSWEETFCDDYMIEEIEPNPSGKELEQIQKVIYDEMNDGDFEWDGGEPFD